MSPWGVLLFARIIALLAAIVVGAVVGGFGFQAWVAGPGLVFVEPQKNPPVTAVVTALTLNGGAPSSARGEVFRLIAEVQQQCDVAAKVISARRGGGFTSLLSMLAKSFMATLVSGHRAEVTGNMRNYTNFLDVFQHSTVCKSGSKITKGKLHSHHATLRRIHSTEDGRALLYDVAMAYLVRLNKRAEAQLSRMRVRYGVDNLVDKAYIAVHIRAGDSQNRASGVRIHPIRDYVDEILVQTASFPLSSEQPIPVYVASDSAVALTEICHGLREAATAPKFACVGIQNSATALLTAELTTNTKRRKQALAKYANEKVMWEILLDFIMLSKATIFIGTYVSNVSRWAAAVRRMIAGLRKAVFVADQNEVTMVRHKHHKYGLPTSREITFAKGAWKASSAR